MSEEFKFNIKESGNKTAQAISSGLDKLAEALLANANGKDAGKNKTVEKTVKLKVEGANQVKQSLSDVAKSFNNADEAIGKFNKAISEFNTLEGRTGRKSFFTQDKAQMIERLNSAYTDFTQSVGKSEKEQKAAETQLYKMSTAFQALFGDMKESEIPNSKEIMRFWKSISSDQEKLNRMGAGGDLWNLDNLKEHYDLLKQIYDLRKKLAEDTGIKKGLSEVTGVGKNVSAPKQTVVKETVDKAKEKVEEQTKPKTEQPINGDDVIDIKSIKKRRKELQDEISAIQADIEKAKKTNEKYINYAENGVYEGDFDYVPRQGKFTQDEKQMIMKEKKRIQSYLDNGANADTKVKVLDEDTDEVKIVRLSSIIDKINNALRISGEELIQVSQSTQQESAEVTELTNKLSGLQTQLAEVNQQISDLGSKKTTQKANEKVEETSNQIEDAVDAYVKRVTKGKNPEDVNAAKNYAKKIKEMVENANEESIKELLNEFNSADNINYSKAKLLSDLTGVDTKASKKSFLDTIRSINQSDFDKVMADKEAEKAKEKAFEDYKKQLRSKYKLNLDDLGNDTTNISGEMADYAKKFADDVKQGTKSITEAMQAFEDKAKEAKREFDSVKKKWVKIVEETGGQNGTGKQEKRKEKEHSQTVMKKEEKPDGSTKTTIIHDAERTTAGNQTPMTPTATGAEQAAQDVNTLSSSLERLDKMFREVGADEQKFIDKLKSLKKVDLVSLVNESGFYKEQLKDDTKMTKNDLLGILTSGYIDNYQKNPVIQQKKADIVNKISQNKDYEKYGESAWLIEYKDRVRSEMDDIDQLYAEFEQRLAQRKEQILEQERKTDIQEDNRMKFKQFLSGNSSPGTGEYEQNLTKYDELLNSITDDVVTLDAAINRVKEDMKSMPPAESGQEQMRKETEKTTEALREQEKQAEKTKDSISGVGYHGAKTQWTGEKFDMSKTQKAQLGQGMYLTTNYEDAKNFLMGRPEVKQVEYNLEKCFMLTNDYISSVEAINKILGTSFDDTSSAKEILSAVRSYTKASKENSNNFRKKMLAEGFQGMYVNATDENGKGIANVNLKNGELVIYDESKLDKIISFTKNEFQTLTDPHNEIHIGYMEQGQNTPLQSENPAQSAEKKAEAEKQAGEAAKESGEKSKEAHEESKKKIEEEVSEIEKLRQALKAAQQDLQKTKNEAIEVRGDLIDYKNAVGKTQTEVFTDHKGQLVPGPLKKDGTYDLDWLYENAMKKARSSDRSDQVKAATYYGKYFDAALKQGEKPKALGTDEYSKKLLDQYGRLKKIEESGLDQYVKIIEEKENKIRELEANIKQIEQNNKPKKEPSSSKQPASQPQSSAQPSTEKTNQDTESRNKNADARKRQAQAQGELNNAEQQNPNTEKQIEGETRAAEKQTKQIEELENKIAEYNRQKQEFIANNGGSNDQEAIRIIKKANTESTDDVSASKVYLNNINKSLKAGNFDQAAANYEGYRVTTMMKKDSRQRIFDENNNDITDRLAERAKQIKDSLGGTEKAQKAFQRTIDGYNEKIRVANEKLQRIKSGEVSGQGASPSTGGNTISDLTKEKNSVRTNFNRWINGAKGIDSPDQNQVDDIAKKLQTTMLYMKELGGDIDGLQQKYKEFVDILPIKPKEIGLDDLRKEILDSGKTVEQAYNEIKQKKSGAQSSNVPRQTPTPTSQQQQAPSFPLPPAGSRPPQNQGYSTPQMPQVPQAPGSGNTIGEEAKKVKELDEAIRKVPDAINVKNNAFTQENTHVDNIIDAEIGKVRELAKVISEEIPQTLDNAKQNDGLIADGDKTQEEFKETGEAATQAGDKIEVEQEEIKEKVEKTKRSVEELKQAYLDLLAVYNETGDKQAFADSLNKEFTAKELQSVAHNAAGISGKNNKSGFIDQIINKAEQVRLASTVAPEKPEVQVEVDIEKANKKYEELRQNIESVLTEIENLKQGLNTLDEKFMLDSEAEIFKELINVLEVLIPEAIEKKNNAFRNEVDVVRKVVDEEKKILEELVKAIREVIEAINFKNTGLEDLKLVVKVFDSLKKVLDASVVSTFKTAFNELVEELKKFAEIKVDDNSIFSSIKDILNHAEELKNFANILKESEEKIKNASEKAGAKKDLHAIGKENEIFTTDSKEWQAFIDLAEKADIKLNDILHVYRTLRKEKDNLYESFRVVDINGNSRTIGANTEGILGGQENSTKKLDDLIKDYNTKLNQLSKAKDNSSIYQLRNEIIQLDKELETFVKDSEIAGSSLDLLREKRQNVFTTSEEKAQNNRVLEQQAREQEAIKQNDQAYEEQIKIIESLMAAKTKNNQIKVEDIRNGNMLDPSQKLIESNKEVEASAKAAKQALLEIYKLSKASGNFDYYNQARSIYGEAQQGSQSSANAVVAEQNKAAQKMREESQRAFQEQIRKAGDDVNARIENEKKANEELKKQYQERMDIINGVYAKRNSYNEAKAENISKDNATSLARMTTAADELAKSIKVASQAYKELENMFVSGKISADEFKEARQTMSGVLSSRGSEESKAKIDDAITGRWQKAQKEVDKYLAEAEKVKKIHDDIASGLKKNNAITENQLNKAIDNMEKAKQAAVAAQSSMAQYGTNAKFDTTMGEADAIYAKYKTANINAPDYGFENMINGYKTLIKEAEKYYQLIYEKGKGKNLNFNEEQYLAKFGPYFEQAKSAMEGLTDQAGLFKDSIGSTDQEVQKLAKDFEDAANSFGKMPIEKEYSKLGETIANLKNRVGTGQFKEWLSDINDQYRMIEDTIEYIDWNGASEDQIKQVDDLITQLFAKIRNEQNDSSFKLVDETEKATVLRNSSQWMANNSAATEAIEKIRELQIELQGVTDQGSLERIRTKIEEIKKEAYDAGKAGKSFGEKLKGSFGNLSRYLMSFASFYRVIGTLKQAVNVVKELDKSFTEMRKVSDESIQSLRNFQFESFNMADKFGTTAKQIQDSTADWLRLGEDFKTAQESAGLSNMLLNVSEFQDINSATESLVAMSQAYKDIDKIDIIDKLNNIGL